MKKVVNISGNMVIKCMWYLLVLIL